MIGRCVLLAALLPAACAAPLPVELEVMTYNLRYGTALDGANAWPFRSDAAIAVIAARRPDVVGLQEVLAFQREALCSALPDYEAFGVGRKASGGGEQCTILFLRERLRRVDGGTFWLSDTPAAAGSKGWDASLPRICTWVALETADGVRFTVFNTHFDHRGVDARLESARLLARRVADRAQPGPAVVMGDLNAAEDSAPIATLTEGLVDTFRALEPDAVEVGTAHGFGGRTGGAKIDYVLVTPGVQALAAGIVRDRPAGRWPSDHFPVTARVRLTR
ncbi:MAG: endonuclease [Planctomycetes bacterium]|jgi:endonuclease/exonuclease/phosphatase family metal-dependent hydrolase|nr:endonuclease [Planctomycetota bacterium]MDP6408583.1 endonuclease/exonuclease/phosphatase family protein [Planctomycetota bacterium]